MMMATNYSNKQNLEHHWLSPTISEVLAAAGPQQRCPTEAPAHICLASALSLVWVVYSLEPTFRTWHISHTSPDPRLLMKNGQLAKAALLWHRLLEPALPVLLTQVPCLTLVG